MNQTVHMLTDEQLVRLYQDTSERIHVGELFSRYKHLVYGVCLKYLNNKQDSQDALMDIFEKLIHQLPGQDIRNFKNWLYTLTRNHCLSQLYKHQKTEDSLEYLKKNEKSEAEVMEFQEKETLYNRGGLIVESEHLQNALKKLDKDQRICVELFFIKNKRYRDIVAETDYTLNQVKSYLQNGRRRLKRLLLEEVRD